MEQKPVILSIEEAKQELVQCVNNIVANHRLPLYFLEPVFADLYGQIKAGAQNELAQARAQMATQEAKDGAE